MKRTIGVFAHVDAGKTTFCEALLHAADQIRKPGSVNGRNTVMDHEEVERRRGITVFSDVASFLWQGNECYLIDTPGHADFSPEMERALLAVDCAVVLINGMNGVQSHTLLLFQMLKKRNVPVFFFINKTDADAVDVQRCFEEIKSRLSLDCFFAAGGLTGRSDALAERISDYDEGVMEEYLEGRLTEETLKKALCRLVMEGSVHPVFSGSALKEDGIRAVMDGIVETIRPEWTEDREFSGRVFKVSHDERGNKVAFVKCLGGRLTVKDSVSYQGLEQRDKAHEIRVYQGKEYRQVSCVQAGGVAGVTGLSAARAGMGVGACGHLQEPELKPTLKAAVSWSSSVSFEQVMSCLRRLEEQDPLLKVEHSPELSEITIHVMGKIQLEVLKAVAADKYGLELEFGECRILYKETVKESVVGYGHYEPLRHYGEVHVKIEPNPGNGVEYASQCHPDQLAQHHQNVILRMLAEKEHRGILTGSGLTDVSLVLLKGGVHEKHTEGGDLRQAAFRAVRQGLEKAEMILLEPCYNMEIQVEACHMGRVLADITRLHGSFSPPVTALEQAAIKARGPVETFMDYAAELASFTQGRGAVSMAFGGYAPCHDPERVITAAAYEKERDLENTSSSVFCAKGAGFEVKWQEAEAMMHLL